MAKNKSEKSIGFWTVLLSGIGLVASVLGIGAAGWTLRGWSTKVDESISLVHAAARLQVQAIEINNLKGKLAEASQDNQRLQTIVAALQIAPTDADWEKTNQYFLELLAGVIKASIQFVSWGLEFQAVWEPEAKEIQNTQAALNALHSKVVAGQMLNEQDFETMRSIREETKKRNAFLDAQLNKSTGRIIRVGETWADVVKRVTAGMEGANLLVRRLNGKSTCFVLTKYPRIGIDAQTGNLRQLLLRNRLSEHV